MSNSTTGTAKETRIRLIAEAIDAVCSLIHNATDTEIPVLVDIATRQVEMLWHAERRDYNMAMPREVLQAAASDFFNRCFNATTKTHTIGSHTDIDGYVTIRFVPNKLVVSVIMKLTTPETNRPE